MRSVALRDDIAEKTDIIAPCQTRSRLALVAVELPVAGARRLADDEYIHLAAVAPARSAGIIGESLAGRIVTPDIDQLTDSESEIIRYVDRKYPVAQHAAALKQIRRQQQHESRSHRRRTAATHPATERRAVTVALDDDEYRQSQQRQKQSEDDRDGTSDVGQKLARLAGVRRQQIGKHVGSDYRVAEQRQQYDLERCEEDEDKTPEHHYSATPRSRDP